MGGIRSTLFFSSAGRSFRNLESLADRRIPINSPRVYQRPAIAANAPKESPNSSKTWDLALMFPDRRRPKRKKAPRAAVPAFPDRDLALHSAQFGQAADLLLA